MFNFVLFSATVLIWGTSWIAIAAQTGPMPVLASVFLRFALAAAVFIAGLALLGRLERPNRWTFVFVQACLLFSLNFICFYSAAEHISSGLISVVFSLASIFNAVNARLFFGEPILARTGLAALLGLAGLAFLFAPELLAAETGAGTLMGIGFAALGTLLFSLGNMASRKNAALGVSPVTANAWGMGIGALILAVLMRVTGTAFAEPSSGLYWGALLYLAIIGSVVGFTTYLMLVQRIGSAKAGYATVLFPVVALTLSALFEGYVWTDEAAVGLGLVMLGNVVMFAPRRRCAIA